MSKNIVKNIIEQVLIDDKEWTNAKRRWRIPHRKQAWTSIYEECGSLMRPRSHHDIGYKCENSNPQRRKFKMTYMHKYHLCKTYEWRTRKTN